MNTNNTPKFASHNDIDSLMHHNAVMGYHFFSPSTMRSFRTRVQSMAPYSGCVFVTSDMSPRGRVYSVRCILENGSISTHHSWIDTRAEAHRIARTLAEGIAQGRVVWEEYNLVIK